MLGEKGIGRLAISTIGPQVLVLTRARRGESLSDLTVAFVNWTLFECPGIDLEDIQVPIRVFPGGELPSAAGVVEMVEGFLAENAPLEGRIQKESYDRLRLQIQQFRVDPQDIDSYLGQPTLRGSGTGTHFIILPTSDILQADIDGEPRMEKATPLTKALLGFTNTMTPGHPPPVIKTAFRDHRTEELSEDLIAGGEFFLPEQFENADHQIRGVFDAYGQFRGDVSVYGDLFEGHVIPWTGARGRETACGPFSICFAAIEGRSAYSTLPSEDHARMSRKMEQIGGLYIYRDGIRILPYGDTDYDWLDIEIHRTKSAYYYYFSHRKMFGAIEIDSQNNGSLNEKAGREGFRENRAYRQFKSILKNFLVQVAADFFRKEGVHGERFQSRKAELTKMEADRERRERLVSEKRRRTLEQLKWFFEQVEARAPQDEVLKLSESTSQKLKLACGIADAQRAAVEVIQVEQDAQAALRSIEARYKLSRPRVALSKAVEKEWNDYSVSFAELADDVFTPARELITDLVREEAEKARVEIDRQQRVEAVLDELGKEARRQTREGGKRARLEAGELAEGVAEVARTCLVEVEAELRGVVGELQRIDISEMSDDDFVGTRGALESRILKVGEDRHLFLASVVEQLKAVDLSGESSALDQLLAIEQRNVALEDKAEDDLQLAQLGMAVEVINHEFNATIRAIRNSLRKLRAWADLNSELQGLYQDIRASFDHLDGYLTLFTPLQRRLYRRTVEIKGSEIYTFARDLFRERLARHDTELVRTSAFSKMQISGFPSSFYPVFVNLIDNAIYWVSKESPGLERRVTLDARDGALLVSDTGPGVNASDRSAIFDFGFTRKPGGRGMGLHIAREVLRRVGWELSLMGSMEGERGTTFRLAPVEK